MKDDLANPLLLINFTFMSWIHINRNISKLTNSPLPILGCLASGSHLSVAPQPSLFCPFPWPPGPLVFMSTWLPTLYHLELSAPMLTPPWEEGKETLRWILMPTQRQIWNDWDDHFSGKPEVFHSFFVLIFFFIFVFMSLFSFWIQIIAYIFIPTEQR